VSVVDRRAYPDLNGIGFDGAPTACSLPNRMAIRHAPLGGIIMLDFIEYAV
jgi:hypothetical protein